MARFLIEVPHQGNGQACVRAVEVFLKTGSHFLTHADWGCKDGVHKAWITVELDSKQEAVGIVPRPYRAATKVVQLNSYTMKDLEEMLRHHGPYGIEIGASRGMDGTVPGGGPVRSAASGLPPGGELSGG